MSPGRVGEDVPEGGPYQAPLMMRSGPVWVTSLGDWVGRPGSPSGHVADFFSKLLEKNLFTINAYRFGMNFAEPRYSW